MNFLLQTLMPLIIWCERYVTAETCNLDCGPGYVCTLKRSTCDYPPCPVFPTCSASSEGPVWSSGRYSRPGQCPAPVLTGPCINNCVADVDCPAEQKCCLSRCGRSCRSLANVAVEKFGTCARSLKSFSGSCKKECVTDSDCYGHQKCCKTSCGAVCSDPCYYWLQPNQRYSRKPIIRKLPFICRI
ncbi:serine-type endopeptidase inhibitor [Mactra antiquata]